VVSSLKKVDPIVCHAVYEPVLLSDSPRPASFEHVAKWLRLSHTLKWITHCCFNQIKHPERRVAIGFHPVSKVLTKLFLEHGRTCDVTGHL
jgi:hypothetical protein